MRTRNVAIIIFYDNDKKILLQDRRGISKVGEKWGFFGGGIEEGETPEQAVVRETKEELNFDLKDYRYVCDYSYKVDETIKDKFPFDVVICKVFVSPLEDKLSKFKCQEGKEMKLLTFDEAEKLKMVSKEDSDMLIKLKKILTN